MAFYPDGERLAAGTQDGRVQLVDVKGGRVYRHWKAHEEGLTSIAVSPDSRFVVTGAGFSDEQVKIWNANDGTSEGALKGHTAWITALAFSPDGNLLASASADQSVRLWDFRARELLACLRGHLHEVWSLAFLPDGKTLLSGDKRLPVLNENQIQCLFRRPKFLFYVSDKFLQLTRRLIKRDGFVRKAGGLQAGRN